MGSWWNVKVGQREVPVFGKNFVSDQLMLLFTGADRFVDEAKRTALIELEEASSDDAAEALGHEPSLWHTGLVGYSAEAAALKSRLELQGFSSERVLSLCTAYFEDEIRQGLEEGYDLRDPWETVRARYPDAASITAALASRKGQAAAAAPYFRLTDPEQRFLNSQWESLRESFDDPRFILALVLTNTRATTNVTLDLTDLVHGGWMDIDDVPHHDARTRMATAIAASGPVIVVTEGPSDARWLKRALEVAAPATAHLFEFLAFSEYQAPGGTDRVVSLTKGMAAAKVMNRIVAVLDNDTAGRAAANRLAELSLPERITVTNLPDVPYATQYPALGPEGLNVANVNGRAASIEFMFGDEILRDTDGSLIPVRWQSFDQTVSDYQGRLDNAHKKLVGQRLDTALGKAEDEMTHETLTGCRLLSDMLLTAADPPAHVPASEFSGLTPSWRVSQL